MDKAFLLEQLGARLRAHHQQICAAADEARLDAKTGAPRAVNMAKAQMQREAEARAALDTLGAFRPRPLRKGEPIGLGAVVEVEDGEAGRTLFIAPVGAAEELTGPDGDGFFQVVTPMSPLGKALMGKRVGDVVEIPVKDDYIEWTIVFAA